MEYASLFNTLKSTPKGALYIYETEHFTDMAPVTYIDTEVRWAKSFRLFKLNKDEYIIYIGTGKYPAEYVRKADLYNPLNISIES